MSKNIPIHGSMTRPGDPKTALKEVKQGRQNWTGGQLAVSISTEEFTSVCPTTGQPDFNTIQITYQPKKYYLESKTIKYYLWAYREHGAHCETLAKSIAEDLHSAIDPEYVEVIVNQFPRGGLKIVSRYRK